jgi:membrane protease YdiL (CAAX protease family)
MRPLDIVWNRGEARPRFLPRLLILCLVILALAAAPILLVADPLTTSHKGGHFLAGLSKRDYDRAINMIVGPLLTAAVLAGVLFTARFVDRRPVSDLGFKRGTQNLEEALAGFLLGGILMLLVFLTELRVGWLRVTGFIGAIEPRALLPLAFSYVAVKNLCVGFTEEAVSRGYLLPNLIESLGFTTWSRRRKILSAALLSSISFGAMHLVNPHFSILACFGLTLNGMMLAAGFLLTGRLALPIALHASWNLFQGTVFGFPVSGDREAASLIVTQLGGPAFSTGGAFGPEGGLTGIFASAIGLAGVCLYARARRSRDATPSRPQ